MKSLISAKAFKDLYHSQKLIIIDARPGQKAYATEHITGAFHLDLNKDLSAIKENAAQGGRHPLPSPKAFSHLLAGINITPQSHIIIYDKENASMAAARLWWMLRAAGLSKVQVLDGGLSAAKKEGIPTDNKTVTSHLSSNFSFAHWQLPLVDIQQVEEASKTKDKTIVDVRASERYLGKKEPIDPIAGHIPSAINLPFTAHLKEDGTFLSAQALREKYQHLFKNKQAQDIIVHCGSGVTACHTLLALDYAGFDMPNLYVGSWSEWSRNQKPIVTQQD